VRERTVDRVKARRLVSEDSGQNLVEFALLLPVLMYILMGILQFGLIFAAYVTINNAAREGARWGSIYVYDGNQDQAANDTARQNGILDRVIAARGVLSIPDAGSSTSNFDTGSSWTAATPSTDCGNTSPTPDSAVKRGDVVICYTIPSGITANDARRGYYMEVTTWYHQSVFVPLLDIFLADDPTKASAQRSQFLRLPGRVTVVIN
jgi:Flp pilus assembly protein TadG